MSLQQIPSKNNPLEYAQYLYDKEQRGEPLTAEEITYLTKELELAKQKNKSLAKQIRQGDRKILIGDMFFVCKAYCIYNLIEANTACLSEAPSPEQAQHDAIQFEAITGLPFNAKHFIYNPEDITKEIARLYQEYEMVVDDYTKGGYNKREVLDRFCKVISEDENGFEYLLFNTFSNQLATIYKYLFGKIDKAEFLNRMVDVNPLTGATKPLKAHVFRKQLSEVSQVYKLLEKNLNGDNTTTQG